MKKFQVIIGKRKKNLMKAMLSFRAMNMRMWQIKMKMQNRRKKGETTWIPKRIQNQLLNSNQKAKEELKDNAESEKKSKKKVVHIPRHLVHVHGWSYSRSRTAVTQFNLRKKYTFKSQETAEAGNRKKKQTDEKAPKAYKDYHKKRICSMLGCSACVKRLPAHLKNVHGISPGSDDLKSLLKKALPKRERPYSVQLIEKRSSGERLTKSEELFFEKKAEVLREEKMEVDMADGDESLVEEETVDSEKVGVEESVEIEVENDETDLTLITFAKWLQSPDGGKKDAKTVKQHASQIKRVVSVIDTDKKAASLLDFNLVKEKFVKYAEEKYVPETIKSYLTSIQHF